MGERMVEWNKQLGARIRKRRKFLGLSLRQLGRKTEIHYSTLASIERGEQCPSFYNLSMIAQSLSCSTDWFSSEDGDFLKLPKTSGELIKQFQDIVFLVRQKWTERQLSHLAQGLYVIAEGLLCSVELPESEAPVDHKPGSEEKIETMAERYARGERLWNSQDCRDHEPEHQTETDFEDWDDD